MASSIIYLPHGGGPLPLQDEPNHLQLIRFLRSLTAKLTRPKSILVVSAHWEEQKATLSSHPKPSLLYDYYGFAAESYQIQYPAPGSPELANKLLESLTRQGLDAQLDQQRGLDHGTFVPLKLIYPDASIPVVQLSLCCGLDAKTHIQLGQSIAEIVNDDIMIIGSGMSFHNLNVLMSEDPQVLSKSRAFDDWLNLSILSQDLDWEEKTQQLVKWQTAPHARFAHPREEHLLPLHVCFGAAKELKLKAKNIFDQIFLNTKVSGFMWDAR